LLKAFDAIPKAARESIRPSIEKGAEEMTTRMRYLAPHKTGALRSSIQYEMTSPLSARVHAGGDKTTKTINDKRGIAAYEFDYSLAVEFGTKEAHAEPFFWPAYRTSKKRVRRRVDRAIGKAVKEAWTK
jgi:HK97 gp10 family phage protein